MYHSVNVLSSLKESTEQFALDGPPTREHHDAIAPDVDALHSIEVLPTPKANDRPDTGTLRVAAWNLERCKYPAQSAALLRTAGVDIALVSEMDYGMARSGNINTTRYIAEQLAAGYAFAVEFVELGIGNKQETALFKGQANSHGYHGNAIISSRQFRDPQVIPVGEPGSWFSHDWHHRRLGQRNGVMATVDIDGVPINLVSVHLENLSTPDQRRDQMLRILERLDDDEPAVIAGDLNTSALPDMSADSDWFTRAPAYEPLFELMSSCGFHWKEANTADQTRRIINDGRPLPLPRRIDWFFVRGVRAFNPITWPAETENGLVLSDHELITVDVRLS